MCNILNYTANKGFNYQKCWTFFFKKRITSLNDDTAHSIKILTRIKHLSNQLNQIFLFSIINKTKYKRNIDRKNIIRKWIYFIEKIKQFQYRRCLMDMWKTYPERVKNVRIWWTNQFSYEILVNKYVDDSMKDF